MVKEYNKDLIEKGILKFDTSLHVLNSEKGFATLIPPFPALKKLGVTKKEDILTVTITKKS